MKRQMPLRSILMLSAIAVVLLLSACGAKTEDPTQGSNAAQEPSVNQGQDTPQPVEPAKDKATVNVYVAADDDLSSLKEQQSEIEFASSDEKIEQTFKALQKDGAGGEMSLWKNVELLHVKVEGKAVTIDVHLPDEARLGAPGEELAMESIQKTMFQFDDVDSLDILVDGEQVESLMGHDELEHPFKKPAAE
ncbi:GerMN domain-containing protein [Paenibacillus solisilvae]|uniref:GerMN domain-containing protein n=1 Tax=Paenibacillus solisilvae TaxID=2486751 RepID=A0ABW0W2I9_9BACL